MESKRSPPFTLVQKLGVARMKTGEDDVLSIVPNNQEKWRRS
jgi:hypothetical protein